MPTHPGQRRSRWQRNEAGGGAAAAEAAPALHLVAGVLPSSALDERLAILGTSGAGKTYAAKGLTELLLDQGARVCVVDPLGVWWGLRSSANGTGPGYPVVVFGGRHADVALDEGMGAALGRLIGTQPLACVVDLSELGSSAARRRFMAAFAEALYEANEEPLHLVLDEADLWAPQRPLPDAQLLLGRVEEIVRRGRVRGFIPWLITQRPAVVHKDVLSQADILVAMKLTSAQDRDAIGGWIEGQADRTEGKRILAELPRLARGEAWVWAPGHEILVRTTFPPIRTFDSSRTPKRGERVVTPRTLAEVDLSAIVAALATAKDGGPDQEPAERNRGEDRRVSELEQRLTKRDRELEAARARIASLEAEAGGLRLRLNEIAALAASLGPATDATPSQAEDAPSSRPARIEPTTPPRPTPASTAVEASEAGALHPAARKLLVALARHAPGRFTWGQAATLAGLKPSGGHYNAGRKQLRDLALVEETGDLVMVSALGLAATGEVAPPPSTPGERLALWCERLPSPAPEMLRALAGWGVHYTTIEELAAALGKKASGGHWNSGLALLRNNGLVEVSGRSLRVGELFR